MKKEASVEICLVTPDASLATRTDRSSPGPDPLPSNLREILLQFEGIGHSSALFIRQMLDAEH